MKLRAENVTESGREFLGYVEVVKTSLDLTAGRLLVRFTLTGYPEQHYSFGRVITAALWQAHDLDSGIDDDKAKALLLAERPAFQSVAKVAWRLPNLEVTAE